MNTDTGEIMPIDPEALRRLRDQGYPVTEPEPGQQVVMLPDPVYQAEKARIAGQAKARRRKERKQADRSRRAQRGK